MPELPDLLHFKEYLDATALHKRIEDVLVLDEAVLEGVSPSGLAEALTGRNLVESRVWGKYLFAGLDQGGWLVLHFGMTGFLSYHKQPSDDTDHTKLVLVLENGYRLVYDCARRLGRIALTDDPGAFAESKELGIDALSDDLTPGRFEELLLGRRGRLKSLLMNQKVLAGIGNVYSDEILFQAGLHPDMKAGDVQGETARRLLRVMRRVLREAAELGADPERFPDTWLTPRREEGADCPGDCPGKVRRIVISGRGAYLCPQCQKGA